MEYKTRINQDKINAVSAIKEEFGGYEDFIFADYRGVTVEQITEIRQELAKKDAKFRVVKNRYAKIAMGEIGKDGAEKYMVGPTAIALTNANNSGEVAKILFNFAKTTKVEVKGGFVAGSIFDTDQMQAYSKLPTRDELLSSLLGTMKAPIQKFVQTLDAVPTKLVRTLQAVLDQKNGK